MAIKLTGSYSKKLGLPGFSSHSFSATVENELTDLGEIQGEVTRLYGLLQDAVDREIQTTGFIPDEAYGLENGHSPTPVHRNGNGNGEIPWQCSDKQKEFILKIVDENRLDRHAIDKLAQDRFGKGVRQLNKLEASGLIDELLEKHGDGKRNGSKRRNGYKAGRAS